MAAPALDYVRYLNRLSEDLLHSHSELLGRKNIRRKHQLIRAIKLDLDKLTHALVEAKHNRAQPVLQAFFPEAPVNQAAICARLADQRIYHVGFEIHEPIALVLYGIRHWIDQSKRTLDVHMEVREFLSFPASEAFQKRVGAYADIMRIWIEVRDRVLMLELFDIHRPADSVLAAAPRLTHRNFHPLFRENEAAAGHPRSLARLFADDAIWHYAFYVKSAADVAELHAELQAVAERDSRYFLPYAAPVHNLHDGSFHTKIVQRGDAEGGRMELEFVTQYAG